MRRRKTTKSFLLRALVRGGEGGVGHLLPGGRQEQVEAAMVERGEEGAGPSCTGSSPSSRLCPWL